MHGYHLPLSSDVFNATEVPYRAAESGRLNAVVAPAIPYCYSGGELPGTVNVSPHAVALFLMDICMEFIRNGFTNIAVYLGHGGEENNKPIYEMLKIILRKNQHRDDIVLSVIKSWELSPTWIDIFNRGPERDMHAGEVETSLMMYWRPDLVREPIEMDEPETAEWMRIHPEEFFSEEKVFDHEFIVPKTWMDKRIKVGIAGFPEKASRELGEKISKEMEDGLVRYIDLLNNNVR